MLYICYFEQVEHLKKSRNVRIMWMLKLMFDVKDAFADLQL